MLFYLSFSLFVQTDAWWLLHSAQQNISCIVKTMTKVYWTKLLNLPHMHKQEIVPTKFRVFYWEVQEAWNMCHVHSTEVYAHRAQVL